MGVTHVSVSGGLFDEGIGGNRTIVEQQNNETDRRYFKRIAREPIEFEMNLLLDDDMTDEQIHNIIDWLVNDYYEELFFEDETDRIYYCMPSSQPRIIHNGMNQGYITIEMRCYDAYLYSREITRTFDLSDNPVTGTTISLVNDGHVEVYPIMTVQFGETSVEIINLRTNETLTISGVDVGETITIDNAKEEIVSDIPRYDNHNEIFLRLLRGNNDVKIVGKCTVEFQYRYKQKY
jgi:phage-related protein